MIIDRRSFLRGSLATAVLPHLKPSLPSRSTSSKDELWYTRPAERWLRGTPHWKRPVRGNGLWRDRGGADCAIRIDGLLRARLPLGEVNPGALPHLHEIRELFFAGKYSEAQELCREYLPGHMKNFRNEFTPP